MLGSRGVSVKTVRPCVLRHRVTHLHPMPSRITRNSHRPRASDRTMVASEATSSLAALLNSTAASPAAEKLTRMNNKPNFSRELETSVGWIVLCHIQISPCNTNCIPFRNIELAFVQYLQECIECLDEFAEPAHPLFVAQIRSRKGSPGNESAHHGEAQPASDRAPFRQTGFCRGTLIPIHSLHSLSASFIRASSRYFHNSV